MPLAASALVLMAGCVVQPGGIYVRPPVVAVAPPPPPVVVAPAPVVEVEVPDVYVWDGFENVGYVGGVPYYLGPGNVWIVCDGPRVERFNVWVGGHPDWRVHAIRNDNYRRDRFGHEAPRRDERGSQRQQQQQERRQDKRDDRRDDVRH